MDRPFVPHNLISTQESPAPLLKFQMAPRLKILMASGSYKGTQIYFSLQSPSKRNPSRFPNTAPMEKGAHLQGICISLKTSSFRFSSKGALPQGPLDGIPRREMPHHYSPPSFIY